MGFVFQKLGLDAEAHARKTAGDHANRMAAMAARMTPEAKFSLGLAATGIAVLALIVVLLLMMGQIFMEMPR